MTDRDMSHPFDHLEAFGPVLALKQTIEQHVLIRPSAIMLPLSLAPDVETAWGMPVIRGDRIALVYEPPTRR